MNKDIIATWIIAIVAAGGVVFAIAQLPQRVSALEADVTALKASREKDSARIEKILCVLAPKDCLSDK